MKLRRLIPLIGMGIALCWFFGDPAWAQCSMCRTALDSPEGRELASAFRRGILFLLTVPFGAVGIVALLIIRGQRRQDADESEI